MSEKIRLIWDFRGPDAKQIAEHYRVHLDQFAATHELKDFHSGIEPVTDMYYTAYFEVLAKDKESVEKALRPHRLE